MMKQPRHLTTTILVPILLAVCAGLPAGAVCAPEGLVRIAVRDATPTIPQDSFAAQPKVIYRLGKQYGRIEEATDPENLTKRLIVVNEPDTWRVNLLTKKGIYKYDRSEEQRFEAPVFNGSQHPEFLRPLEYGCELSFMKEHATRPPQTVKVAERELQSYEIEQGRYRVMLAVVPGSERPFALGYFVDGELVQYLRYLVYQDGLPADTRVFWPPAEIEIDVE
jgi:hypothetical protein